MPYLRHTITVDFSGDHDRQIVGVGIVIQESRQRGRRGPIVEELSESVQGINLGEGEKYAVLRALELAAERGIKDQRFDRTTMQCGGSLGSILPWRTLEPKKVLTSEFSNWQRVHSRVHSVGTEAQVPASASIGEACTTLALVTRDPNRLNKSVPGG